MIMCSYTINWLTVQALLCKIRIFWFIIVANWMSLFLWLLMGQNKLHMQSWESNLFSFPTSSYIDCLSRCCLFLHNGVVIVLIQHRRWQSKRSTAAEVVLMCCLWYAAKRRRRVRWRTTSDAVGSGYFKKNVRQWGTLSNVPAVRPTGRTENMYSKTT